MWRSSIPRNWSSISSRPARRIKGSYGKRDTMEFLRETLRYIDTIRKPISGDEEILGVTKPRNSPRLRSLSPPSTAASAADRGKSNRAVDSVLASPITLTSTPVSRIASPTASPPPISFKCPLKKHRGKTASLTVRPGITLPGTYPAKQYLVNSYLIPHSLVHRVNSQGGNRPKRRAKSPDLEEFLTRFDRKPCATVASPSNRAMPGWKLTGPRACSPQSCPKRHSQGRQSPVGSPWQFQPTDFDPK